MSLVSKCVVICALIFFIACFLFYLGPRAKEKREQAEERCGDALVIRLLLEGKGLKIRDVTWIVNSPDADERLYDVAKELGISYEKVVNIQECLFVKMMPNPELDSSTFDQKNSPEE